MPTAASSRFAAIVVAAGQGLRAGQPMPKQFAPWRGKPVVRHSVEALLAAGADPVVVAIPEGAEDLAARSLAGLAHVATANVHFVTGGATRQQSVAAALEQLGDAAPFHVLIHDAARPVLPGEVIDRLLEALAMTDGAIPVLPAIDSMVTANGDRMGAPADRESLRRVQTPQAFRFDAI